MKRLLLISIAILSIASCTNEDAENNMHLTGSVKGLKKGTLLLQKVIDSTFQTIDSLQVNGTGDFEFNSIIESPEVYYLSLKTQTQKQPEKNIPFFAEAGEMTINTSLLAFNRDSKITGSVNEDKFREYRKLMQRYADKNLELTEAQVNAYQEGNMKLFDSINGQQKRVLSSKYLATVNYALNNKDYEIAPFLALTEIYDVNVKYLDTIYTTMTPKIKDSKYGIVLESFIKDIKKIESN
ncbi:DUF4369 domain-containing protein [Patiriisocius marinus]|uniref:DUF4369 domain-containing protein n=1 Tax=Patiriisocius marinus TaxID=1397112 RepID=A0A5J4J2M6_9FLAO|nr:DUF4369 domain-containing protein [Patiriisocius marinus]GER60288.1 hypothetical protein ULMA_23960 [Patiriisocius marinus]